ncbi:SEC-C metal-binding domain-containing protein [Microbulbifer bruguierae]|uniref:SEC-C metal-binding domain-containing protein n=1 Tax=Microbulbifer bruguierae TaxID=3029061 RepID=A0ABY8NB84_9GAMM|nr:SEC-C metal-binding domain-containing protein [Microbulbifer bruguierae]WGL16196.1 SEC-C metal-binding domain-containing protein [Microbulbifer bruguierae]
MTLLTNEQERKELVSALIREMEATALDMRALILAMPPEDLLGYIYAQRLMKMKDGTGNHPEQHDVKKPDDTINDSQFLLEYVHAVLASDSAAEEIEFDETKCTELFALSSKLKEQAMSFAMVSSAETGNQDFGPKTADIEFHMKSTWVLLRGNRYQVLEGEFYSYVLAPHDDVLREVYGVGATEIADGFQDMANATRAGHVNAMEEMMRQFESAHNFAKERNKPLEEVMEAWVSENEDQSKVAGRAIDDMFRGGVANVSRHTKLPPELLADLAYQRGEETEFFAKGDFSGTPYRTLPVRKKPLIQLESDYYAVDPCFTRDAGYRALLFNLLQKKPDYKHSFKDRQKTMSEGAFPDILADQLPGATIYQEVYYKDPMTKQWTENDTLVLVDDVLYLVEAKAGAAATIASPEIDFKRHAQSVQDLVLKAYSQCERFFNYLDSADEVPLYTRTGGKYEECGRIRQSDYRLMLPIGLTVESFSPFSSFCKDLPQIEPLLGKHAFISMSIDDLFVLKRVLPTPGIFSHYMEVRQAVAGMRGSHLFDEFDHLGAYITKNRFDEDIADQMRDGGASFVVWNDMSKIIDRAFEGESWEDNPIPMQDFPKELIRLLGALNTTRSKGWLGAESLIRNYGEQERNDLAKLLSDIGKTVGQHPERYFAFSGNDQPLFVWMQSSEHPVEWQKINDKASAVALSTKAKEAVGVFIEIGNGDAYTKAECFKANAPSVQSEKNAHIFEDAKRISERISNVSSPQAVASSKPIRSRKVGRNEPCPCGSGAKYKKCHGR